jgi:hypothetical protein
LLVVAVGWACLVAPGGAAAAVLDDIGYTRLRNEQGAALPRGSSIVVAQAEAADGKPDPNNIEFAGKTLNDASTGLVVTQHATTVGQFFFGNNTSPAPGIVQVQNYSATGWLTTDVLRVQTASFPEVPIARVANHSWVSQGGSETLHALQRMDFLVETDDYLQVVGVNFRPMGQNSPQPEFAGAMNVIAVGTATGAHSTGTPAVGGIYSSGRTRPHLVGPIDLTVPSFTTPLVAGTAAMLIELAEQQPGLSNGSIQTSVGRADLTIPHGATSEAIRAIVMAGANRRAVLGSRANPEAYAVNTANGLSDKYGAGVLDVYESFHIMAAGETDSVQAGGPAEIRMYGYDYAPAYRSDTTQTYPFTVDHAVREFAATLSWNLEINLGLVGGQRIDSNPALRNLNLHLRDRTSGEIVAESVTNNDTVENLYLPMLAPGSYELIVDATGFLPSSPYTIDYGLAWRFAPRTPPVLGDVNLDSLVSLADLGIIGQHVGMTQRALRTDGDLDGDGAVDRSDVLSFLRQYASTPSPAAASPGELAQALGAVWDRMGLGTPYPVPEPSAGWLALAGVVALPAAVRCRRRRRC